MSPKNLTNVSHPCRAIVALLEADNIGIERRHRVKLLHQAFWLHAKVACGPGLALLAGMGVLETSSEGSSARILGYS
jgi:hypothetical protein